MASSNVAASMPELLTARSPPHTCVHLRAASKVRTTALPPMWGRSRGAVFESGSTRRSAVAKPAIQTGNRTARRHAQSHRFREIALRGAAGQARSDSAVARRNVCHEQTDREMDGRDFFDLASEEDFNALDLVSRAAGKRPRLGSPQKAVSNSPSGRGRKRRRNSPPQIMMADGKLLDLGGVVPGLVRLCVPCRAGSG